MNVNLKCILNNYGDDGINIVVLLNHKLSLYLEPAEFHTVKQLLQYISYNRYNLIYSEAMLRSYLSKNCLYPSHSLYQTYSESIDTGRGFIFNYSSKLGSLVYLLRSPSRQTGFGVYAISRIERGTACLVYTGDLVKSEVSNKRQIEIYDPKVRRPPMFDLFLLLTLCLLLRA